MRQSFLVAASDAEHQPNPKAMKYIHSYVVEILLSGKRIEVDVEASNRNAAASMVRKQHPGCEIRSVNMIA